MQRSHPDNTYTIYLLKTIDQGENWTIYYERPRGTPTDITYHKGNIYIIGSEWLISSIYENYTEFMLKLPSALD